MNEKYFVAAFLRWQQAEKAFTDIKENMPKVGEVNGIVSTWGHEVRLYREAKQKAEAERDAFTKTAAEYAQWLYSRV